MMYQTASAAAMNDSKRPGQLSEVLIPQNRESTDSTHKPYEILTNPSMQTHTDIDKNSPNNSMLENVQMTIAQEPSSC